EIDPGRRVTAEWSNDQTIRRRGQVAEHHVDTREQATAALVVAEVPRERLAAKREARNIVVPLLKVAVNSAPRGQPCCRGRWRCRRGCLYWSAQHIRQGRIGALRILVSIAERNTYRRTPSQEFVHLPDLIQNFRIGLERERLRSLERDGA